MSRVLLAMVLVGTAGTGLAVAGVEGAGSVGVRNVESAERGETPKQAPVSADREAQRQTLAEIRNLGTATLSWLVDQIDGLAQTPDGVVPTEARESAPVDRGNCPGGAIPRAMPEGGAKPVRAAPTHYGVLPTADAIEYEKLERILRPSQTFFYMKAIPRADGWGEPLEVFLHLADLEAPKVVTIRSPGRDGEFETDCYEIGPFDPDDADQDIVWADGFFVRWPGANAAP